MVSASPVLADWWRFPEGRPYLDYENIFRKTKGSALAKEKIGNFK